MAMTGTDWKIIQNENQKNIKEDRIGKATNTIKLIMTRMMLLLTGAVLVVMAIVRMMAGHQRG